MPVPITINSGEVDLSQRYAATTTVGASPALAAETIIGTLNLNTDLTIESGIRVAGWAAFTVGTTGANIRLRIRRTNVAGTVVADTGALTGGIAAAALVAQDVEGFDTGAAVTGQTYVLTLQVGSATAASTVSALLLEGLIV